MNSTSERWYTRTALALLVTLGTIASVSSFASESWSATKVDWNCRVVNSDVICDFVAQGPLPTGSYPNGVTAKGWYRVLKSSIVGRGQVLMTKEAVLNCSAGPSLLKCIAKDEVKLGPGISIAPDFSSITMDLTIYASNGVKTPLFDVDGDGRITSAVEGLVVMRHLLGLRGSALTQGVALGPGKSSEIIEEQLQIGVWNRWFQFGSDTYPRATNEGKVLLGCLRGLRGEELIAGLPAYSASVADAQCNLLLEKN